MAAWEKIDPYTYFCHWEYLINKSQWSALGIQYNEYINKEKTAAARLGKPEKEARRIKITYFAFAISKTPLYSFCSGDLFYSSKSQNLAIQVAGIFKGKVEAHLIDGQNQRTGFLLSPKELSILLKTGISPGIEKQIWPSQSLRKSLIHMINSPNKEPTGTSPCVGYNVIFMASGLYNLSTCHVEQINIVDEETLIDLQGCTWITDPDPFTELGEFTQIGVSRIIQITDLTTGEIINDLPAWLGKNPQEFEFAHLNTIEFNGHVINYLIYALFQISYKLRSRVSREREIIAKQFPTVDANYLKSIKGSFNDSFYRFCIKQIPDELIDYAVLCANKIVRGSGRREASPLIYAMIERDFRQK